MKSFIKSALVLTVLTMSMNAFAENAKSRVPSLNFQCSVNIETKNASTVINNENTKITINGKIRPFSGFSVEYIPAWEKKVIYDAGGDYSVKIEISALKYRLLGDELSNEPSLAVTASLLKRGTPIAKANTSSRHVTEVFNVGDGNSGKIINLKLGLENILPITDVNTPLRADINCDMPITWAVDNN